MPEDAQRFLGWTCSSESCDRLAKAAWLQKTVQTVVLYLSYFFSSKLGRTQRTCRSMFYHCIDPLAAPLDAFNNHLSARPKNTGNSIEESSIKPSL